MGNGGTAEHSSVLQCYTLSLGKKFPMFEGPDRQHVLGLRDPTDMYFTIINVFHYYHILSYSLGSIFYQCIYGFIPV